MARVRRSLNLALLFPFSHKRTSSEMPFLLARTYKASREGIVFPDRMSLMKLSPKQFSLSSPALGSMRRNWDMASEVFFVILRRALILLFRMSKIFSVTDVDIVCEP